MCAISLNPVQQRLIALTEKVIEDTLGSQDNTAEEQRRLAEGHERHQVHTLVLSLLKARMNPSAITALNGERNEMNEVSRGNRRNGGKYPPSAAGFAGGAELPQPCQERPQCFQGKESSVYEKDRHDVMIAVSTL